MAQHRWTKAQKEFIQERLHLNTKTLYRQFVEEFGNIEPGILSSQASQIRSDTGATRRKGHTNKMTYTDAQKSFLKARPNMPMKKLAAEFNERFGTNKTPGSLSGYRRLLLDPDTGKKWTEDEDLRVLATLNEDIKTIAREFGVSKSELSRRRTAAKMKYNEGELRMMTQRTQGTSSANRESAMQQETKEEKIRRIIREVKTKLDQLESLKQNIESLESLL